MSVTPESQRTGPIRPSIMHGEEAPIDRLLAPLNSFLRIEAVSGIVLFICTAIALIVANSPIAARYDHFWHQHVGFQFGEFSFTMSLLHLINDGLMTIFFFVVGLEIKREIVIGELRDPRTAMLPVVAAIGGMLAPATIFLLIESGRPGEHGWGIPTATDIAFVVGILALFGKKVPLGLKLFLLSLAIADDLGAVVVIALFYSSSMSLYPLLLAIAGMVMIVAFQRLGVWSIPAYLIVGTIIWLGMLQSGIHPTIAGVVLGFATPIMGRMLPTRPFEYAANEMIRMPMGLEALEQGEVQHKLAHMHRLTNLSLSPLERLETTLHKWVAFIIMPVFALANAAVPFDASALGGSVTWAVALGLIMGKPIGIVALTGLSVVVGLGRLPTGVTWPILIGGACLGGIGFTMSLFVASLAFEDPALLATAKLGILIGSAVSATLGSVLLWRSLTASVEDS